MRVTGVNLNLGGIVPVPVEAVQVTADGGLMAVSGKVTYTTDDFLDSIWTVDFAEGDTFVSVFTQINSVRLVEGRYRYEFTLVDDPEAPLEEGEPSCAMDDSGFYEAVLLGDLTVDAATGDITSRPNTMFIACLSGAMGKAASLGYVPGETVTTDEYEASVRMLRADYCGDGRSYTLPGTPLLYWDSLDPLDARRRRLDRDVGHGGHGGAVDRRRRAVPGRAAHRRQRGRLHDPDVRAGDELERLPGGDVLDQDLGVDGRRPLVICRNRHE